MPVQIGKRYVCPDCGAEVMVTKAGDTTLYCVNSQSGAKTEMKLK